MDEAAPAGLEVTGVRIELEGARNRPIPVEFSATPGGAVASAKIHLSEPRARLRIEVLGRLPAFAEWSVDVPWIELLDADGGKATVQINAADIKPGLHTAMLHVLPGPVQLSLLVEVAEEAQGGEIVMDEGPAAPAEDEAQAVRGTSEAEVLLRRLLEGDEKVADAAGTILAAEYPHFVKLRLRRWSRSSSADALNKALRLAARYAKWDADLAAEALLQIATKGSGEAAAKASKQLAELEAAGDRVLEAVARLLIDRDPAKRARGVDLLRIISPTQAAFWAAYMLADEESFVRQKAEEVLQSLQFDAVAALLSFIVRALDPDARQFHPWTNPGCRSPSDTLLDACALATRLLTSEAPLVGSARVADHLRDYLRGLRRGYKKIPRGSVEHRQAVKELIGAVQQAAILWGP